MTPASVPPPASEPVFEDSDLQLIEKALLEAILDVRPDRDNAIDRLLSDPAFGRREEAHQFITAALLDTGGGNRGRALDQMLDRRVAPPRVA
jgi:hypothetical protein